MSNDRIFNVSLGKLRGRMEGNLAVLRGVPYALPPTGNRRFCPPAPMTGWTGVRDAVADGPIAPQTPSRVYAAMGAVSRPQAEDCLTLTIWAPCETDVKLPVIIWLHGGGFATGAGSLPWYDGALFAERHKVIVVAVNYRLGALGYLYIPGVVSPNIGLLDQEEAVRWVKREIAVFGGDPERITLMGQSGGAHTIVSLLTMPRTGGLFRRAILQSGPLGISFLAAEEAAHIAATFLQALDLSPHTPDLAGRLRLLSLERILAAQTATAQKLGRMQDGDLRPPFMPTEGPPYKIDQSEFIKAAAKRIAEQNIEVMIGWTREEVNIFFASLANFNLNEAGLEKAAARLAGAAGVKEIDAARRRRPEASPQQLFSDIVGDLAFKRPSMDLAYQVEQYGGRAFVYQFDWQSPDPALGACHCIDLPFVFGTWDAWSDAKLIKGMSEAAFRDLSVKVMQNCAGFAAGNGPGFDAWQADRKIIMHIDMQYWAETV